MRSPERVGRLVAVASLAFALLGYALPFIYGTPLFSVYRGAVADWVSPGAAELDRASATVLPLGLGILGGSIAGKWIMHFALAYYGVRRGQRWAYEASVAGLLGWFVVDSAASIRCGAVFNVLFINLLPLIVGGGPLLALDRGALSDVPAPRTRLAALGAMGVMAGLTSAFATETVLFAPWWDATGRELLGAPMAGAPRALMTFLLGPIGGCIVGHFAMITLALWRGPPERWVFFGVLGSLVDWFVFDSAFNLAMGAYFNLLAINVTSMVLMAPALIWLHRRTVAA